METKDKLADILSEKANLSKKVNYFLHAANPFRHPASYILAFGALYGIGDTVSEGLHGAIGPASIEAVGALALAYASYFYHKHGY